jgi:2-phosphoglycerate kinase
MLYKYIQKHGRKWRKLSKMFEKRTPIKLKNYFYSYLRKENVQNTLKYMLEFLEKVCPIEDYSSEDLEKFKIFFYDCKVEDESDE